MFPIDTMLKCLVDSKYQWVIALCPITKHWGPATCCRTTIRQSTGLTEIWISISRSTTAPWAVAASEWGRNTENYHSFIAQSYTKPEVFKLEYQLLPAKSMSNLNTFKTLCWVSKAYYKLYILDWVGGKWQMFVTTEKCIFSNIYICLNWFYWCW